MFKKYTAAVLAAAILVCGAFSGCESKSDSESKPSSSAASSSASSSASSAAASSAAASSAPTQYTLEELGLGADYLDDTEHEAGYQLDMPQKGEEVAILHTSMGDIYMHFFPEACPKTVENFLTHAKNGYYDGLTFHRIMNDFMIQGGDPNGNGTGGESVNGGTFEDEFSNKLFNLRGSVAMANSGPDTNGSQFFINQKKTADVDSYTANWNAVYSTLCTYKDAGQLEAFIAMYGRQYNAFYDPQLVPDDVKKLYTEQGGNPTLDGAFNVIDRGHTVFAQVYEGMDVVDKIAAVEVDASDKPLTPVIIESIEVMEYK